MPLPDIPHPEGVLSENLDVPESVRELVVIERRQRKQAFRDLFQEIGRLELLGVEDASRQSFHRTYTEEGERSVLFYAQLRRGIGRTFRVIVNDQSTGPEDQLTLRIRDFIVPAHASYIGRAMTSLSRTQHKHQWNLEPDTGPILVTQGDAITIYEGKRYRVNLPYLGSHPDAVDILDRRIHATELADVLTSLNPVTLEEGFQLAE